MFCHDKEAAARARVELLLAKKPEIEYIVIARESGVSIATVKRRAVALGIRRKRGPKSRCS